MAYRQQIILIDENPATRSEMVRFISGNLDYNVKDFDSIFDFINHLQIDMQVDLVLLEITSNEHATLDHIFKIRRLIPEVKILITTKNVSESTLIRAIREGATGYFVKRGDWQRLALAIRHVLADDAYVSPEATKYLLKYMTVNTPQFHHNKYDLNRRETEVLNGLMEGLSYQEIATKYFVSINTVRHYVLSLYRKTGVNSRHALQKKMKNDQIPSGIPASNAL